MSTGIVTMHLSSATPEKGAASVQTRKKSPEQSWPLKRFGAYASATLFVQGSHLGLVSTSLRVRDDQSLDAVYRVIETSALGTLTRKHFWFAVEIDGKLVSACEAYLAHYKVPGNALGLRYGYPKLLQRRSLTRLLKTLSSDAGKRGLSRLLDAAVRPGKVDEFRFPGN